MSFSDDSKNSKYQILIFVILLAFVFVLHGTPVPITNEFAYLVQLQKHADADFLANDWTFAHAGNEHWLFNRIFGVTAVFAPIEIIGWAGRIICWIILLILLLRFGEFWQIKKWQIGTAIFLWLAWWQAPVGGEWLIGTFEAKSVAYVFLLFALIGFGGGKTRIPAILLGLTFSFHPSVGLWGALAIGWSLIFTRTPIKKIVEVVVLTAVFSLIGILPLIGSQINQAANLRADWEFIVLEQAPGLFDPFRFSISKMILLAAMLAFNFWALARRKEFALRFLLHFQIAAGLVFAAGIGFRFFGFYELLRFTPFRLFPLFTPLFFAWTVFLIFAEIESKKLKTIFAVFVSAAILGLSPIQKTVDLAAENYRFHTRRADDLDKIYAWLAANTPENVVVIQPPTRTDAWYRGRRAQIAGFSYPVYEKLGEWRERISDLTGGAQIHHSKTVYVDIEAAFNSLTTTQIEILQQKYEAKYLVSRAAHHYPVVFETESYKIYKIDGN